jgi:hypothetical protein
MLGMVKIRSQTDKPYTFVSNFNAIKLKNTIVDNFTNKQRTKKIISDMKLKLNADTFRRRVFLAPTRKMGPKTPFLSPFSKLICIRK